MIRRLINSLRRRHKDIYELAKEYAEEKGVPIGDVIAAGLTALMGADEEMRDQLIEVIRQRGGGGGGTSLNQLKELVGLFKDLTSAVADIMSAAQEVSYNVAKRSIVTELKNTMETVEEIKRIGQSRGGVDQGIADAFINLLLSRVGVKAQQIQSQSQSKPKKKHEIKEIGGEQS